MFVLFFLIHYRVAALETSSQTTHYSDNNYYTYLLLLSITQYIFLIIIIIIIFFFFFFCLPSLLSLCIHHRHRHIACLLGTVSPQKNRGQRLPNNKTKYDLKIYHHVNCENCFHILFMVTVIFMMVQYKVVVHPGQEATRGYIP